MLYQTLRSVSDNHVHLIAGRKTWRTYQIMSATWGPGR
jgi:hypothetical protein